MLTEEDRDALESSAVAGDAVIDAAFAVAVHSHDLDYLAALFKDIAANRRDNPQVLIVARYSLFRRALVSVRRPGLLGPLFICALPEGKACNVKRKGWAVGD